MSKNNADFFKVKNPWSVIKDRLLRCYLAPYFQKVLTTNKPIFYKVIYNILTEMQDGGQIDIIRNPLFTKTGKPSAFWEEERGKTVTVRRVQ